MFKKADYDSKENIKNKSFSTSDYNKFTNNILDAKITLKMLVNESGFNENIKILATKEVIKNSKRGRINSRER